MELFTSGRGPVALAVGIVLLTLANPAVAPAADTWWDASPEGASARVDALAADVRVAAAAPVAEAVAFEARLHGILDGFPVPLSGNTPEPWAWFYVNGEWSDAWVAEAPYLADVDGDGDGDRALRVTLAADGATGLANVCFSADALPLGGGVSAGDEPVLLGAYHAGRFLLANSTDLPNHVRLCVRGSTDVAGMTLEFQSVPPGAAPSNALAFAGGALLYVAHDRSPATTSSTLTRAADGTIGVNHAGAGLTLAAAAFSEHEAFLAAFPNGTSRATVAMTPPGEGRAAAFSHAGEAGVEVVGLHWGRDLTFGLVRGDAPASFRVALASDGGRLAASHEAGAPVPDALLMVLDGGSRENFTLAWMRDAPARAASAMTASGAATGFEHDASGVTGDLLVMDVHAGMIDAVLASGLPSRVRHTAVPAVAGGTLDAFIVTHAASAPTASFLAYSQDALGLAGVYALDLPASVDFSAGFRDPTASKPTPVITLAADAPVPELWAFLSGPVLDGGVALALVQDAPTRLVTSFPALDATDAGRVRYDTAGTGVARTVLAFAELPAFLAGAPAQNVTLYALNLTAIDLRQKAATDAGCPGCQYWPTRESGVFLLGHPALMVGGADVAEPRATWRVDECVTRWGAPGTTCDGARASWTPAYTTPWAGYAIHVPQYLTPNAPVRAVPVVGP